MGKYQVIDITECNKTPKMWVLKNCTLCGSLTRVKNKPQVAVA